jgi:hypothetical protein
LALCWAALNWATFGFAATLFLGMAVNPEAALGAVRLCSEGLVAMGFGEAVRGAAPLPETARRRVGTGRE